MKQFIINVGVIYNKVINNNKNNRLLFLPGISWRQTIDVNEENDIRKAYRYSDEDEQKYYYEKLDSEKLSLGLSFGIEFKKFIYENISLTITGGYHFSFLSSYIEQ